MKTSPETSKVVELPVSSIQMSKHALRRLYDEEAMTELGQSISEIGNIYPLVVKPLSKTGTRYELIIGSRRLKAVKNSGVKTAQAVILSGIDDKQSLILALAENLQRQNLTPFEEASGFLALIKDFKMSEKEIAKRLSVNETLIRNRLKLLSLPLEIQEMVAEKQLGIPQVNTIASLPKREQIRFAEEAVENALSDAELSVLVRQKLEKKPVGSKRRYPQRFTGKRVSLKIQVFSNWLSDTAKHISSMSKGDQRVIGETLEELVATIKSITAKGARNA